MVEYDESFFLSRADELYSEADTVQSRETLRGGIIGLAIGTALGFAVIMLPAAANAGFVGGGPVLVVGVVAASIGAVMGWQRGRKRADSLRYQAQEILWKVQVEHNTRTRLEERGVAALTRSLPDG